MEKDSSKSGKEKETCNVSNDSYSVNAQKVSDGNNQIVEGNVSTQGQGGSSSGSGLKPPSTVNPSTRSTQSKNIVSGGFQNGTVQGKRQAVEGQQERPPRKVMIQKCWLDSLNAVALKVQQLQEQASSALQRVSQNPQNVQVQFNPGSDIPQFSEDRNGGVRVGHDNRLQGNNLCQLDIAREGLNQSDRQLQNPSISFGASGQQAVNIPSTPQVGHIMQPFIQGVMYNKPRAVYDNQLYNQHLWQGNKEVSHTSVRLNDGNPGSQAQCTAGIGSINDRSQVQFAAGLGVSNQMQMGKTVVKEDSIDATFIGLFRVSIADHLDAGVIQKIRNKQFVELATLLPPDVQELDKKKLKSLKWDPDTENITYSEGEDKTLDTFTIWSKAFRIYMAVYLAGNTDPDLLQQMLSYERHISTAASMHARLNISSWRTYDYVFRKKMSKYPHLRWDARDEENWNFLVVLPMAAAQSVYGAENGKGMEFQSPKICRDFNSTMGCSRNYCKFAHACAYCKKQNHPEEKCLIREREENQEDNEDSDNSD